ncbi:MAG: CatB-related O-acetyltransferase [Rhodobacteraceae bacterium]|nr:CatB-related O-acetyltransferase [Paracoccaceae bacterium]
MLTVFLGGNHRMDWSSTYPFGQVFLEILKIAPILGEPLPPRNLTIGNDVWIGANVTIMSGITIDDGAVVGANSTVTRSIGPYEIWGGNPARFIRHRFPEDIVGRLTAMRWWDWPLDAVERAAPLLCTPPTDEILSQLEQLAPR